MIVKTSSILTFELVPILDPATNLRQQLNSPAEYKLGFRNS